MQQIAEHMNLLDQADLAGDLKKILRVCLETFTDPSPERLVLQKLNLTYIKPDAVHKPIFGMNTEELHVLTDDELELTLSLAALLKSPIAKAFIFDVVAETKNDWRLRPVAMREYLASVSESYRLGKLGNASQSLTRLYFMLTRLSHCKDEHSAFESLLKILLSDEEYSHLGFCDSLIEISTNVKALHRESVTYCQKLSAHSDIQASIIGHHGLIKCGMSISRDDDGTSLKSAYRNLALKFEEIADGLDDAKVIEKASYYSKAVSYLRPSGFVEDDLDRMTRKLTIQYKLVGSHMPTYTVKTDVTELHNITASALATMNTPQKLAFLARQSAPIKRTSTEKRKAVLFRDILKFNTEIVDAGRLTATTEVDQFTGRSNGSNETLELINDIRSKANIGAGVMVRQTLNSIISNGDEILEWIDVLVRNNLFIEADRYKTFFKGLIAYFECDFITASCILVPQVEYILRNTLEIQGGLTVKLSAEGVTENKLFPQLIREPLVRNTWGEQFCDELEAVFVNQLGPNTRNTLAHGLGNDLFFKNVETVYAVNIVLYMVLSGYLLTMNEIEAEVSD